MFEAVLHDAEVMGHRFLILLARSNLGRVAARAGRFAEAQEQLEQAVEIAREIGALSFVLEVDVRLAELDALRGGHAGSAMTWIAAVLERSSEASGMAPVEAAAQRTRAAALYQLGEPRRAAEALAESVRIARAAEVRYELALSLDLVGALGDEAAAAESAELLTRLGVSRVARPPLD